MSDQDKLPTFLVVAENGPFKNKGSKDGCHLVFKCPKCGTKNYHGGVFGEPGAADGHRFHHCGCWPDGYYIKEIGD